MILFVGNQSEGYFVSDVAAEQKETVTYTGTFPSLSDAADAMLESPYDVILCNVEELPGSHADIADVLLRVQKATKSTLLVLARRYSPQSELMQPLLASGFPLSHVILSDNLPDIKAQLGKLLQGEEPAEIPVLEPPCPPQAAPGNTPPRSVRSIAVVGANSRMGTTTQAIQMVKYLQFRGKTACCVQMNPSSFLTDLKNTYEITGEDASLGKITFQNVDLFTQEKISRILQLGYAFYVYDYGVWEEVSRTSFLEKDRKFLVCGISPQELPFTNRAISACYDAGVEYLFNLVPPGDRESILAMMEEQADRAYFPAYTPDPFVYSSQQNECYDAIFRDILHTGQSETKPTNRKSAWWKRRN